MGTMRGVQAGLTLNGVNSEAVIQRHATQAITATVVAGQNTAAMRGEKDGSITVSVYREAVEMVTFRIDASGKLVTAPGTPPALMDAIEVAQELARLNPEPDATTERGDDPDAPASVLAGSTLEFACGGCLKALTATEIMTRHCSVCRWQMTEEMYEGIVRDIATGKAAGQRINLSGDEGEPEAMATYCPSCEHELSEEEIEAGRCRACTERLPADPEDLIRASIAIAKRIDDRKAAVR